jgi:large subunit ribosomal protein L30
MLANKLNVKMTKSKHGRLKAHQECLKGLGLKKINQVVQVIDTPENRGMINKVSYMLKIEEV